MRVRVPFVTEIAPETYLINEFGLSAMYLLVGEEKALLIDAGCGLCDLNALIASLTDKPCALVLTHGHMDHVGGIGSFSRVYLNKADWAMARGLDVEALRRYAEDFGKAGSYQIYDYSPSDIKMCEHFPEFLNVEDGDVFDLGGRTVTAYHVPGHTAGGIVLLDEKNRILFSGDCCNVNLLAVDSRVSDTLKGIQSVKALSDRFDQNFNGHVGYMGSTVFRSQPKALVDDLIYICQAILRGEGEPKPFDFLGHHFQKMYHGCAGISYNPENL